MFKAVNEISDQEASFVVSAEEVVLGPFEQKVVHAKSITPQPDEFHFRNGMVHPFNIKSKSPFLHQLPREKTL